MTNITVRMMIAPSRVHDQYCGLASAYSGEVRAMACERSPSHESCDDDERLRVGVRRGDSTREGDVIIEIREVWVAVWTVVRQRMSGLYGE